VGWLSTTGRKRCGASGGSNRGHKREDPIEEKLADAWVRNDTSSMAWFYLNVLID